MGANFCVLRTFLSFFKVLLSAQFRTSTGIDLIQIFRFFMANKQFGMEVKKHYEIRKGMYYNEYVGMTLSDEGMRCMALARGTEPSVAPVKSSPLYEQTRLKN